jgi:hypothetical protein
MDTQSARPLLSVLESRCELMPIMRIVSMTVVLLILGQVSSQRAL